MRQAANSREGRHFRMYNVCASYSQTGQLWMFLGIFVVPAGQGHRCGAKGEESRLFQGRFGGSLLVCLATCGQVGLLRTSLMNIDIYTLTCFIINAYSNKL